MCTNENSTNHPTSKVPVPFSVDATNATSRGIFPFDPYRLQLYQYAVAERLRYPLLSPFSSTLTCYPFFPRTLQPEEPKPQHSYIGLIAMAILSSPDTKLVLSDIYQHILDHYPYFRTRGPGWRNSIRHNLSLNDCFIKAGRSANGKGHYWAIHPANVEDFRKGDFRRRKAQRKVRKHMGLAVDEDGADSPSPPPLAVSPHAVPGPSTSLYPMTSRGPSKKRQFDVASLLAPDSGDDTNEEDIDVVSNDQQEKLATENKQQWHQMFPMVDYYQAFLHSSPVGLTKNEKTRSSTDS